jgi:hypothetical protein
MKAKTVALVCLAFALGGMVGWGFATRHYVRDAHEGAEPEIAVITIGPEAGLPTAENGEFRIHLCDELLTTPLSRAEYDVIRPVVSRFRTFKNRPPPGMTNGVKTLQGVP